MRTSMCARGEILGVAGLDSSGRTELLENIFGSATRKSGKIYKNGKLVGSKTPRESIKNGFALVTEERRARASSVFWISARTRSSRA